MATFQQALAGSTAEDEVIGLVRDYLAALPQEELGLLPARCRPGYVKDETDLSALAFSVAVARLNAALPGEATLLLGRLDSVLRSASVRLGWLRGIRRASIAPRPPFGSDAPSLLWPVEAD